MFHILVSLTHFVSLPSAIPDLTIRFKYTLEGKIPFYYVPLGMFVKARVTR